MTMLARRETQSNRSAGRLLAAIGLAFLLVACGQKKPSESIASAKTYLAKNDRKAAIIEIKNALQGDPESAEARYLLGTTLLEQGDPVQGEVELRKAARLGYPQDLVAPKIATAMLAHRDAKKVVEEFEPVKLSSAAARAELAIQLAGAHAGLGDLPKAEAAISVALAADPAYLPARLAKARLLVAQRDLPGAAELTAAIVRASPESADGWRLKGDIDYIVSHDAAMSLESYRKAVALKPESVSGRLAIVWSLMSSGKSDEARKELDAAQKLAPNDLQVRYLQGALALSRKDYKAAQEQVTQLLKVAPDNVQVLLLAGGLELETDALAQAQIHLARAASRAPDNLAARRLLVAAYLRSGQPAQALAALFNGLPDKHVDPALYGVAGETYFQTGDARTAQEYFAKAAALDPKDARKRTAVAVARLGSGDAAGGLLELQNVASSDTGVSADMALISAYLGRRQFDKALVAIDALERKVPAMPIGPYYRGRTQLALNDEAAARASFARALVMAPTYFPAVASLSAMDVGAKKIPDAKARLVAFLANDPKNVKALMTLAEVEALGGATKEQTVAAIGKAVDAAPTDPAVRLMLIDVYARAGDAKQALSAAQAAVTAMPENPSVLAALGRAQQASGESNQALATYAKVSSLLPNLAEPYVRSAEAQMQAGDKPGARQSLKKAVSVQPDSVPAMAGLFLMDMSASRYNDALETARAAQKQLPKNPLGYAMEGDVLSTQRNADGAIAAYRKGLANAPSSRLATKLHAALASSGKTAESDAFARTWEKEHPSDPDFRFYLGDLALRRSDFAVAEKRYREIIQLQPSNAAALNNLAWLVSRSSLPDAARYAALANELVPNDPSYMDTYSMILANSGEYKRAIEMQQKVVGLDPKDGLFKLNLAKIYIRAGEKSKARDELVSLERLGEKFPAHAEVSSLIKTL